MPRRKKAGEPNPLLDEVRHLRIECERLEGISALLMGGYQEIGKLIERMPGGMMASIAQIVERHGVAVRRPQKPLQ